MLLRSKISCMPFPVSHRKRLAFTFKQKETHSFSAVLAEYRKPADIKEVSKERRIFLFRYMNLPL